jgi:hypothetical protein
VAKRRISLSLISVVIIVWWICWENKLFTSWVIRHTEPRVVSYAENIVIQNLPMQIQNGFSSSYLPNVLFRQPNGSRTAGVPLYSFFWINDGNGWQAFFRFWGEGVQWDGVVFPQAMTKGNLFNLDLGEGLASIFYREKDSSDAAWYGMKGLIEVDCQPRTLCTAQIRFNDGRLPSYSVPLRSCKNGVNGGCYERQEI